MVVGFDKVKKTVFMSQNSKILQVIVVTKAWRCTSVKPDLVPRSLTRFRDSRSGDEIKENPFLPLVGKH